MAGSRTLKLKILADIDQFTKQMQGTQTGMQKFAAVAKVAAAAAAAYAAKLAIDGVKAAIADEAAQARLATTLQNVTGATNAQIAAVEASILQMSLASGVADDQLRPAFDRLVRATGDMTQSTDLLQLAMDISAGTGKSLESVTNALGKAAEGSTTGLGKLGVGLDKTALSTMSFEEITTALGATFEGQAATQAETFEGRIARLNVAFDEAKESVGAALLPTLENLLTFVTDTAIPAIEDFAGWIDKNKDSIIVFGGALAGLTLIIKKQAIQTAILSGITKAQIAFQAAWNAVMAANPIGLIVVAVAALAAAFVYAWNNSETFRKVVIAVAKAGVNVLAFLIEAIGGVAEAFLEVTTGGLRMFLEALDAVGVSAAGDALDFINNGISQVGDFFDSAAESVRGWNDSIDGWADNTITLFGDTSEAATDAKDVTAGAYEATAAAATASGVAQEKAAAGVSKATKKTADDVKKANDKMEAAWLASAKAAKEAAKAAIEATWGTLQGFNSAIAELKQKQVEYGKRFADVITDVLSLSDAAKDSGEETGKTFMQSLLDQVAKAQMFAAKIKALIKAGLSQAGIDQILAAGADTGSRIADEILSTGSVGAVNALFDQMSQTASDLADYASGSVYGAEIKKAEFAAADARIAAALAGTLNVGGMAGWEAILASGSPEMQASVAPGIIPPYLNITVNGALDPEAVARQINGILQTSANRTGNYTNLGVGNLSLAGV